MGSVTFRPINLSDDLRVSDLRVGDAERPRVAGEPATRGLPLCRQRIRPASSYVQ